jgi:hypothetical protein
MLSAQLSSLLVKQQSLAGISAELGYAMDLWR